MPYPRRRGNPLLRLLVSWLVMREVARQYEQDKPIWEHKIHLPRPVLCDGDGPIWQFRKWSQRFYPAPPIAGATRPGSAQRRDEPAGIRGGELSRPGHWK